MLWKYGFMEEHLPDAYDPGFHPSTRKTQCQALLQTPIVLAIQIQKDCEFWSILSYIIVTYHKQQNQGAGEIAQRLRALAVLLEVLSSILSNHMVAHNHL